MSATLARELAERLARSGQGDAFVRTSETARATFSNGTLVRVAHSSQRGRGGRVVDNGRLGCAGGTLHVTVERLVEDISEAARFGPEVGALQLPHPSNAVFPATVRSFCDETAALTTDQLVAFGREAIEQIRAERQDVVVDATVGRTVTEEWLVNTAGLEFWRMKTSFQLTLNAKRNREGDLVSSIVSCSATRAAESRVQPGILARQVVDQLARCETSATIATGEYPVVLTGDAVLGLLHPLLLALDGGNLARGVSPLVRTRETARFSPALHLFSDPLVDHAPSSTERDGDGFVSRRVDFIRDGRLAQGMFDGATAARWALRYPDAATWAQPGCARRDSTNGATTCSAAVLRIGPGHATDMLDGIDRGLYVESLLGVRMGNPISGEFSNNVNIGHLIENGRLVGRVKDTMVAGNVYAALAKVASIGAHADWVGGGALLPDICVDGLRVVSNGHQGGCG